MTLLSLLDVTKRWPRRRIGRDERFALRGVSLEVEEGELVAVWGDGRSGRRTLLEVCAGLETDIEGVARFDGCDLSGGRFLGVEDGIAFAFREFHPAHGVTIEQVAFPILKGQTSASEALDRAYAMLDRVGVESCSELTPSELEVDELARVMLARALISRPRLVLADGPTRGMLAPERDAFLALARSLADDGIAVLMGIDEIPGITAVTRRLLTMQNGELDGDVTPRVASVTPLRAVGGTR